MAYAYFGDQRTNPTNGNWNTVGNWYSSPGYYDEGDTEGTLLGRLPTEADTVIINAPVTSNLPASWSGPVQLAGGQAGSDLTLTAPTQLAGTITGGVWSGAISGGSQFLPVISGGTFSGPCSFTGAVHISGGTFNNTLSIQRANFQSDGIPPKITAGVFNGAVTFKTLGGEGSDNQYKWTTTEGIIGGTFNSTVHVNGSVIRGGTFYGLVTLNSFALDTACCFSTNGRPALIKGGTYSPAATVNLIKSNGVWIPDPATLPNDPGFAAGGGTYSPRLTLTGLPNILGAGLLL